MSQEALPRAEQSFRGVIGPTYRESQEDYPQPVKAPTGAPNVLLVLIDDLGFCQISVEARFASGAKGAADRTPHLRADADRRPCPGPGGGVVVHHHRLDGFCIAQPEEVLHRLAVIGHATGVTK